MRANELKVGLEVAVGPGVPGRARVVRQHGGHVEVEFLGEETGIPVTAPLRVVNRRVVSTWAEEVERRDAERTRRAADGLMPRVKAEGDILWNDLVTKYPWLAGTRVGSPGTPVPIVAQQESGTNEVRASIRLDLKRLTEALAEITKS